MNKARKLIIKENEISEIVTFSLGKIPQKILIEGKSRDLPVVINLHGGPGSPIPFFCRLQRSLSDVYGAFHYGVLGPVRLRYQ